MDSRVESIINDINEMRAKLDGLMMKVIDLQDGPDTGRDSDAGSDVVPPSKPSSDTMMNINYVVLDHTQSGESSNHTLSISDSTTVEGMLAKLSEDHGSGRLNIDNVVVTPSEVSLKDFYTALKTDHPDVENSAMEHIYTQDPPQAGGRREAFNAIKLF